jgi:hypothetical protein
VLCATDSIGHRSAREANGPSATEKILFVLLNRKFHYLVDKSLPQVRFLIQAHEVQFLRRILKIAKSYFWLCRICLSVRPNEITQLPTDDFLEIWYVGFFENVSRKVKFYESMTTMKTRIHFWLYLAQFFLQWEMFRKMVYRKSKYVLYSRKFILENRAVYEIMWKSIVQSDTPRMKIWRMHIACWMLKGKNTHSEYVICIAFPLQKMLHERPSILRYTYISCLVILYFHPCIIFQVLYSISYNFPTRIFYKFPFSLMPRPSHLPCFNLVTLIFVHEYK